LSNRVLPFQRSGTRFGRADTSNCEREKIHLPGSIQPHGALLVVDESSLIITHASHNAAALLLGDAKVTVIGRSLTELSSGLATSFATTTARNNNTQPVAILCELSQPFDCLMHQESTGQWILEFEPTETIKPALTNLLQQGINDITDAASLQSLCDTVTKLFSALFGYDRVMVYRFAFEGHGEVFAEKCETDMEAYLGNHYPASDIPQIARDLYKLTRVRMLPDVDYQPCTIRPRAAVGEVDDLDMTHCHLRSMSPIHRQYLTNMGVQATLVTSLVCGDKLWGLITCHHRSPKYIGYECRLLAELLAEITATRIAALEGLSRARAEQGVQQFEQSLIEAISQDGDWTSTLVNQSNKLLRPLDAIGAALMHDNQLLRIGITPSETDIRALTHWLDMQHDGTMYFNSSIGHEDQQFETLAAVTPGILAYPLSSLPGEYLIWFRPERVRTICWGGQPDKQTGDELTPRTSFAKWKEELKNTSEHFNESALAVAQLMAASIIDVIQQFHAMRVMIAHDQLETLTDQISGSELPALIADANGNILLRNNAFDNLLWRDGPPIPHISDLPRYFEEQAFASQYFMALLQRQQPWHGSATLDGRQVLIRADAVLNNSNKLLGYVILLTDISDRQMAENARRRFPKNTLEQIGDISEDIDGPGKFLYESLLQAVVENAQLAAMEITDGIDVKRIPTMLEGVEASVSRTSKLIGDLIRHAEVSVENKSH
jgi:light-regulated signal transduction histidine kinase (bacteriophytochrome)